MTSKVTWMWIGNDSQQINSTPRSPVTVEEANSTVGLTATGPDQIRPVDLVGIPRIIWTDHGKAAAFATTYNKDFFGPSKFFYQSPEDGDHAVSYITGFLRVDYKLTFPDNSTSTQEGVLIQMSNGDRFFRPSKDALEDWKDIDQLYSVEIVRAEPLPTHTYVAKISFSPDIFDLDIICFGAGTMILTAAGDVPVETLRAGDMVWTRDHGFQPLRWTGMRSLDAIDLAAKPKLRPVRIEAGALGDAQPSAPLVVSRQHRVLIRSAIAQRMFGAQEVLAPACQLTEMPGIAIDNETTQVTYVHLMFDDHQVVMSNGAMTESLYPGRQALSALGRAAMSEIEAIFPGILTRDVTPEGARDLVRGAKLRRLVARHVENDKSLVS